MKKIIYVVLLLMIAPVLLTGCGSANSSEGNNPSNTN